MAKTGGWCRKLTDKMKANATHEKLGRQRAVITRNVSTFAEKRDVFEAHKRAIHGIERNGKVIQEGGRNPGPIWTYIKKTGNEKAVTFRGDGLPDDSLCALRPPKTNAERAAEDTRRPLKDEMRPGFASQVWKRQPKAAEGIKKLLSR